MDTPAGMQSRTIAFLICLLSGLGMTGAVLEKETSRTRPSLANEPGRCSVSQRYIASTTTQFESRFCDSTASFKGFHDVVQRSNSDTVGGTNFITVQKPRVLERLNASVLARHEHLNPNTAMLRPLD